MTQVFISLFFFSFFFSSSILNSAQVSLWTYFESVLRQKLLKNEKDKKKHEGNISERLGWHVQKPTWVGFSVKLPCSFSFIVFEIGQTHFTSFPKYSSYLSKNCSLPRSFLIFTTTNNATWFNLILKETLY